MKLGASIGYAVGVIFAFTWLEMSASDLSEKVSHLYQLTPALLCVTFGLISSYVIRMENELGKLRRELSERISQVERVKPAALNNRAD